VAAQTLRPVELILVDDGNHDDTPRVLGTLREQLGAAWLRIVALERNAGSAAARNAGWDSARGEYVAFLDADDSWLPRKLERQVAFMRRHPEFALTGHLAHYGDRIEDGAGRESRGHFRELSRASVLLKNPMVTPSFMVRRELGLRFAAGARHMEDHRLLQEAVFSRLRIARLEEVLALVHKPAFGAAGLSAQLWRMEQGELENYRVLRRAGHISAPTHAFLATYSLAKFCRRAAWVGLRRLALPR
jgi:glycosyltransferase involved in cell wall biosynthesis